MAWDHARWVGCAKHFPPTGLDDWIVYVARTAEGKPRARYRKGMSLEQVEAIEMSFQIGGRLIWEKPLTERTFYVCLPEMVGASLGEETRFAKVRWGIGGWVHGYPVTPDELRRELHKRNPQELEHFLRMAYA